VLNNEEEDEGVEKQPLHTMRGPTDSDDSKIAARSPRNLLPCAGEINGGATWSRTADWRSIFVKQAAARPSPDSAATWKKLGDLSAMATDVGMYRDIRRPLVEAACGSCGHERGDQDKVSIEQGLLRTHHPSAPPLAVRLLLQLGGESVLD